MADDACFHLGETEGYSAAFLAWTASSVLRKRDLRYQMGLPFLVVSELLFRPRCLDIIPLLSLLRFSDMCLYFATLEPLRTLPPDTVFLFEETTDFFCRFFRFSAGVFPVPFSLTLGVTHTKLIILVPQFPSPPPSISSSQPSPS